MHSLPAKHAASRTRLYDDPSLYDALVRPGPCEAFYRSLAARVGGPVLELACGTGRLTIPIARDGHRVVGIDASPVMLRAARRKAEAGDLPLAAPAARTRGGALTLMVGDMRDFELDEVFPLIFVSCNSLGHLLTTDDLTNCLRAVRRHLAPGSLFAFDIMNPDLRSLAECAAGAVTSAPRSDRVEPTGVEEVVAYDPVSQIRAAAWRIRGERDLREIGPLRIRQIFPQELLLLLEATGFELAARYGDFGGGALTSASLNQVCVVRASDAPAHGLGFAHAFA